MCKALQIALLLVNLPLISEAQTTIDIFTTHSVGAELPTSMENKTVTVYFVDQLQVLTKSLNQNLLYVPVEKQRLAIKEYLVKQNTQFHNAIFALQKASEYDIKAVPTVVVDSRYEVSGTANAQVTLNILQSQGDI